MVRSTGFSRSRALGGITRIIGARATAKTFTNPTKTKGSLDQTNETTSEYSLDVWLFDPEENVVGVDAGERVTGDLGGLIVDDGTNSEPFEIGGFRLKGSGDSDDQDKGLTGDGTSTRGTLIGEIHSEAVPARIVHGGVEYEADTVIGVPDDENVNYWAVSFIRRQ
jgi:hypothetical protein